MLRKLSFSGILLFSLLCITHIASAETRIAVLDFKVQSDNPAYKYLGKGFAEFIAVELSTVKSITIIERERRNALLEEQKFSVSGLADDDSIELGRLLSADYLLAGNVFDMFGNLAVTARLINAETGEVEINTQADGPPQHYKRLVSTLSEAVITSLEITPPSRIAKAEPETEIEQQEAEEVLSSFSEAVDAVDKNDLNTARIKLKQAEQLDRSNRAVEYYLNKLFTASPKFNVELIFYAPSFNPAYLGFVERDRLYLTLNSNIGPQKKFPNPGDSHADFNWEVIPGLYYGLGVYNSEIGYYTPLGKRLGLGAEFTAGGLDNITRDKNYEIPSAQPDNDVYLRSSAYSIGGRVSAGWALNDRLALGASALIFNSRTNLGGQDGEDDPKANTFSGALTAGVYSRLNENRLTIDSLLTVPFLQQVYIDYSEKEYVAYETAPYPLVWETSAVYALRRNKLFVSLKEVAEIYTSFGDDERRGVASRTIGAAEWWLQNYLSLRAGAEYDFVSMLQNFDHGIGVMGGVTVRLGAYTLDANFTFMDRSLRYYPGLSVPDGSLLIQFSKTGLFGRERER